MQTLAQRMSVADYLAMEERGEKRHEYLDGVIFAMRDESRSHQALISNLGGHAWQARPSHGCQIFQQSMKVHIPTDNCFYYPDVVGSCDSADSGGDYLSRPCFVIEVVSPFTVRTDQSEKRRKYLSLESLDEYVLVYERLRRIAVYRSSRPDAIELLERPDDRLELTCIGVGIALADIYENA